jgi:hypothetical protein
MSPMIMVERAFRIEAILPVDAACST